MFKKLLVCLDGSPLAEQVLPAVEELAARFESQVTLFHAYHLEQDALRGVSPVSLSGEEQAQEYLEKKAQPLKEKGIKVKYAIVEAEYPADQRGEGTGIAREGGVLPRPGGVTRAIGEAILHYAREHGKGLIVLSSHGKTGWRRVLFGSVAEYVLEHSHLPLLVIRPK